MDTDNPTDTDSPMDADSLGAVDRNFATNLREYREHLTLSQDELAQRMTERGFGFTQATIWKIEQGRRAVRIAEAVALMDALGLPSWMNLTRTPHVFRHDVQLQAAHRRAGAAYAAIKTATAQFLWAQAEVGIAAHDAHDAGVALNDLWTTWLGEPAERAVIEARVEFDQEDTHRDRLAHTVDTIMAALRANGYEPTLRVQDIHTIDPADADPADLDPVAASLPDPSPPTKRWGPWRLSNDGRALERHWDDPIRHRPLDLYRCTTAAEVLDTIFHEARAGAADTDDAMLAGLVRALDDLLDPMANLCTGGKARTLSRAALVEILNRGGAR